MFFIIISSIPSYSAWHTCLSLWASFLDALARGGKRKESLQLGLWNLNSTFNFPVAPCQLSCQISANQHEAETNGNVNKHWKTRAKGNDIIILMSSSPISISHQLSWCRYSNSSDIVASCPSFSCPAARVPRRACSQTILALLSCTPGVIFTPVIETILRASTLPL